MREIDPKLGELMKKTRLERRLTQEEVAEMIGCHSQYYKNLENSKGMPSIPLLCKIMHALNISANDYVYPNQNKGNPVYESLQILLSQCSEYHLSVLLATAEALLKNGSDKKDDNTDM